MEEAYVIVAIPDTGSPTQGFDIIGPFATMDEAFEVADYLGNYSWWITKLTNAKTDLLIEVKGGE